MDTLMNMDAIPSDRHLRRLYNNTEVQMTEVQEEAPLLHLWSWSPSLVHPIGPPPNPEASPTLSTRTASNLCSDRVQTMFLQTAHAVLHNPADPCTSLEVCLLLDSGSQKSYISNRARDLLRLDTVGEQSLSIAIPLGPTEAV